MVFRRCKQLSVNSQSQPASSNPTWLPRSWRKRIQCALLVATAGFSTGCMSNGNEELQYLIGEERDLSYYKDQATQIEYPNIAQEQNEAVAGTQEPRRIRHPRKDEIQDISLEGSLRTALQNAEVIRDNASFLNPGNRLLSNPDFASSIYDVAIQESNTLFGQGGVQAALAEFDATLTTNMTWGASEQPAESGSIGVAAFDGQIGQAAYSASKAGIAGMTLPLARDLSSIGVRVNAVAPGLFDTPIYDKLAAGGVASTDLKATLGEGVLFPKRLGTSDELASLVYELLTNSYMNGETIRIDAGVRLPPK